MRANGVTANDAVKNLNTQLLAGKGPDMILLNGMPADAYIEKGILMDLSDFVAELPGNYFEGIFKRISVRRRNFHPAIQV